MITALIVFAVISWVLSTDWILELAAGASLIALPLAILSGDVAMAATSIFLLLTTLWVMARRPSHG